ncbi:MAG TPA: GTP pyrophosphokinase [Lachnospiraceae bacterium]|nr:GTP pyrophosphokinase [Lachnospiraceae bacterium]
MEKDMRDTEEIKNWKAIGDVFQEGSEIERYRRMMMQYQCAMLEVKTKLDVLNAELSLQNRRNPFETIKCRIKSPESIREKMERNGWAMTIENVERHLNDIAGIRVICSFPDDIYRLADCLLEQDDITLISRKDYIKNPKPNGYRSLHLIIEVPIFLTDEKRPVRVEVQFRTIAMDFWASLEHKLKYKKHIKKAESISDELFYCAELISQLDGRMQQIREKIERE